MHEKPLLEVFDHTDIVYLSPDSPNVLENVDPAKVYILGGLVDEHIQKVRYGRKILYLVDLLLWGRPIDVSLNGEFLGEQSVIFITSTMMIWNSHA